jgi:hypothetical protein
MGGSKAKEGYTLRISTSATATVEAVSSSRLLLWLRLCWKKMSTMERKGSGHPHRNLGFMFLLMSLVLQVRLMLFGLCEGKYGHEDLMQEFSGGGRAFLYVYGLAGLALPLSSLLAFRKHLKNKAFNKEKGNTMDTVIVNTYFQVGHCYAYFRMLPGAWPVALTHPVVDWLIATILFTGFDFVVAPTLQRQSLRTDGIFISPTLNYMNALGMLFNKWLRQVMFACIILGANHPLMPSYWVLNFATNSLFTFPIFMFIYTLRMKRLLTATNLDHLCIFFWMYSAVSGIICAWPPAATDMGHTHERLLRLALILFFCAINVRCGRLTQHICFHSVLALLAFCPGNISLATF